MYKLFKAGEVVLYGTNGVCEIVEIKKMKVGKEKLEYYVLKPICTKTSTLFVPTGNDKLVSKMRYVLSADKIKDILESLDDSEDWIEDKNVRFEFCKEVISGGDFEKLVKLVRSLRFHEMAQHQLGKHLHISDDRFLKEAEKMVCDEVSIVLDIDRKEVVPLLLRQ